MGIVKRDSIAITVLSYVGVVVGYVNKILLFPNFLSEEQVGLTSILVSLAVMYAQFSALGINSTVVKFFPFFRTADKRHNGLFFWSALGVSVGFVPMENLVGKARFLFFSYDPNEGAWYKPWTWAKKIRWSRLFSKIN